jgi:hypothetical protein
MDKDTIDKAIWAHSRWKVHLKQAIQTGQSDFSIGNVRNPHICAFGKWLDSAAGKRLPDYSHIIELHENFHKEASHILELALTGQTNEAAEKMQLGSHFNQLTAKLINKLADIGATGKN